MQSRIAAINGLTVAFDDAGQGPDTIVLIHGHPFDRTMWYPQVASVVRAGWRALVPDLRGYGDSAAVGGTTTLDDFARDIVALLDETGVERAVFGGLSMGGQIAMECCRAFQQRVRGAVFAATFPQAETEEGRQSRFAMAERLERDGMDDYAIDVLPRMLAARTMESQPEVAGHVLRMMRGTSPAGAAAALRGRAQRPDYAPTIAALSCPALIVAGSADAFTTRDDAQRMHEMLPGSTLVWMDGIGHMPNLEAPEAFNEALRSFLSSLTTVRAQADA